MEDTGVTSVSFAGTAGVGSLEIGDVGSFLNRFPKIEFLLVGFGATSGVEEDESAGASPVTGLAVSSATTGLVSSRGITGSATAREAIECE